MLFEVPSQWALKLLNPQIWLPTLALLWGVVSVCQGLVHNQTGLFVVRFFLGVSECGLFPVSASGSGYLHGFADMYIYRDASTYSVCTTPATWWVRFPLRR